MRSWRSLRDWRGADKVMLSSTMLREDKEMENSPAASASCFR